MSPASAAAPASAWSLCPTCWGQRRIYEDRNGEGLVPFACPSCLGLGELFPAVGLLAAL